MLHEKLKENAIRWLHERGCWVFADEVTTTSYGIADALGTKKDATIYYIEVKTSRSDLMGKKQKRIHEKIANPYYKPEANFHYFIMPKPLTDDGLYSSWGIMRPYGGSAEVERRAERFEVPEYRHKGIYETITRRACLKTYKNIIYGIAPEDNNP